MIVAVGWLQRRIFDMKKSQDHCICLGLTGYLPAGKTAICLRYPHGGGPRKLDGGISVERPFRKGTDHVQETHPGPPRIQSQGCLGRPYDLQTRSKPPRKSEISLDPCREPYCAPFKLGSTAHLSPDSFSPPLCSDTQFPSRTLPPSPYHTSKKRVS